ncbi:MAG: MFS transporter [Verrucomicrobia bacterium]|nr:MAG: MFS transporter [Verrucomicrobiota bacterium]
MKKPSVFIIFLTVFVDLIGFGIVLPLLPIFAREFNANGLTIGLLMASYSAMQFFFAPVWGKFSDRVGRRPVLLMSTAAAAVSYAVFAVGSGMPGSAGLAVLFFSRIVAGICGANITVAQAYIADITPPEERSKKMGLIGMAFGLGFIFGPVLSGVGMHFFGMTGPGWIAASFCAANFLFALTRLPESWKPTSELATQRPRLTQWIHTLSLPKIGLLVGIFFLATFCFTCFETTLGLLVSQNFHLVIQQVNGFPVYDEKIVYLYAYCGIVGALVQGGAIGRAVKKLGEPLLIAISLVLVAIAMGPMPFANNWVELLIVLAILSIGSSLTRPPVFGLISILTPAHEQGATIGVAQGAGSLARIVGPIFAATLFDKNPALPYLICAALSFFTSVIAWQFLHRSNQTVIAAKTQSTS